MHILNQVKNIMRTYIAYILVCYLFHQFKAVTKLILINLVQGLN